MPDKASETAPPAAMRHPFLARCEAGAEQERVGLFCRATGMGLRSFCCDGVRTARAEAFGAGLSPRSRRLRDWKTKSAHGRNSPKRGPEKQS